MKDAITMKLILMNGISTGDLKDNYLLFILRSSCLPRIRMLKSLEKMLRRKEEM